MKEKIEELTLLLMYLNAWEESGYSRDESGNVEEIKVKHSWKGYSFDTLNDLLDKGYIFQTRNSNKSVTITEEGEKVAKDLLKKYFSEE